MKYTCPRCGYKSLDTKPPGTFSLCPVCNWEDDNLQFSDPDYEGGANIDNLRQSQHRFANGVRVKYGIPQFEKDSTWRLLPKKSSGKSATDYYVGSNSNVNKA